MGGPGNAEFIRPVIKPECGSCMNNIYLSNLNIITSPFYVCACVIATQGDPLGIITNSLIMSLSIKKTQNESKGILRRGLRAIQGLEFP